MLFSKLKVIFSSNFESLSSPMKDKTLDQTFVPVLHSKLQVQFFENLFPERAKNKGVEETMISIIKIQSENMKMTWNISLFICCMIYNFSKCDGFTVL